MRSSRLSARRGLLAAAGALTALLVAAPGAGAVAVKNGPADFSGLKAGIKVNKATAPAKKEGSKGFELPVTSGNVTLDTAPTGSMSEGGSVELKLGSKRAVLSAFKQTFSGNKVTVSATIGGKSVTLFEGSIAGKITSAADFTSLSGQSIDLTLTKAGAKALNKAFGLKKPKRGKKDKRLKAKAKILKKTFNAHRSLSVTGGTADTIYDTSFYDAMQGCGISLSHVPPGETIPQDPATAPRGGLRLPATSGTIDAVDGSGTLIFGGGSHLSDNDTEDPATPGPDPRTSDLTNFTFDLTVAPPTLTANASDLGGAPLQIATVEGATFTKSLTATGGTISLNNGNLKFTSFAQSALASLYRCTTIPAGASLGIANSTLQVT